MLGANDLGATLVILNPRAGPAPLQRSLPDRVGASLRAHGVAADLHLTRGVGDATDVAREAGARGYQRVVVAGGDGTVNEAVVGLAGGSVPLGIVPVGTVNALAQNIGLQSGDVQTACRAVARGCVRRLDLGYLGGRPFANMAGVGLDALIVQDAVGPAKTVFGPYAFVGIGLAHLARREQWRYEAVLDGRHLEGEMWLLLVSNSPRYTWRLVLCPQAAPDDGFLEYTFIGGCSRSEFLRIVMDTMGLGKPASGSPYVTTHQGRHLVLNCDPPAPWQVDGELGGLTPVECVTRAGALPVIVPAEQIPDGDGEP